MAVNASKVVWFVVSLFSYLTLAAQDQKMREPFSANLAETTDVIAVAPQRAGSYTHQRGTVLADSLGRLRLDLVLFDAATGAERARVTRIADPVAGWLYEMRGNQKAAVRRPILKRSHVLRTQPGAGAPSPNLTPDQEVEDLGWRTIEGEVCHGLRQTEFEASPTGRLPAYTLEAWRSERINYELIWVYKDESGVTSTRTLHSLSVGDEPSAGLFKVPLGYEIVDAVPGARAARE